MIQNDLALRDLPIIADFLQMVLARAQEEMLRVLASALEEQVLVT